MKAIKNPAHTIYLLTHGMVFVLGVLFVVLSNQGQLSEWQKVTLFGVGTSLIAAGITGWVVYVYVRHFEGFSKSLGLVTKFGFTGAFSGRSVKIREEYDSRMANFSNRVDILGFGLNSFRQDKLEKIPIWKQQGYIRILLLDPEYPNGNVSFANQRDLEENEPVNTIAQQVKRFVAESGKYIEDGRFEIKLYKCNR